MNAADSRSGPSLDTSWWSPSRGNGVHEKRQVYVADFETTTKLEDCRVWGWGMVAVPDDWQSLELGDVQVGTSLSDFLIEIQSSNRIIYFHNLRFDGRFILDNLLKSGYAHESKSARIERGQIKTLISAMGQFYSITVTWWNGKTCEFRDSAKKWPMTVKRMAEALKMEFGKGDIDYDAERPVGYAPSDEEWEYIRRDVWIVARAIGQQLKQGMHKLTIGADALADFKKQIGKTQFNRLFPVLSVDMDAEIRRAYRGGFTYADPRFRGVRQGRGMVFDVNSLYPSVMAARSIPYGEPQYVRGRVTPIRSHPLTIFAVTFTARLKPGHIPCIQIKKSTLFVPTDYLTEIEEPTTLMVTNVDWDLMNDHYDIEVMAWEGGWRFREAEHVFDKYIDKYMQIKMHSEGGIREIAKLFLNALYGKYATRPDVTGKVPYLDDEGVVRLRRGPDESRDPVYTAAGVFITSYARDVTIRAAQANYDAFAYADTDSLHLITDRVPEHLDVDSVRLGAWKHELIFESAHYIRAKAYLEYGRDPRKPNDVASYHNAVAGIPTHISAALTFEDIVPGRVITVGKGGEITREHDSALAEKQRALVRGKLNPKAVAGGVVLTDTPYELALD